MKRRPRWTQDETAVLERYFPMRGAAYVAKAVGRNVNQVRAKAQRMGVPAYDAPVGYMPVTEAALTLGVLRATVDARARREGVIRRVGRQANGAARVAAVPVKWVQEQKTRVRGMRAATAADWVTLATLSEWTGLTTAALHKYATRGGGLPAKLGVTLRTSRAIGGGGQSTIVVHPVDANDFRVALEKLERRIGTLVSLKRLGVELGVSRVHMHKIARALRVPVESWPRPSGVIAYVTREGAERIRCEYGLPVKEAA